MFSGDRWREHLDPGMRRSHSPGEVNIGQPSHTKTVARTLTVVGIGMDCTPGTASGHSLHGP